MGNHKIRSVLRDPCKMQMLDDCEALESGQSSQIQSVR